MPRVTGPLFSAGASGAFAGVCEFRMVNGRAVVTAAKRMNRSPGPEQQANAERFKTAIGGWKSLTEEQRELWKAKAALQQLTGYQLYLREYLRQGLVPPHQPILPA